MKYLDTQNHALALWSTGFLAIFMVLSFVDGVYLHLWKYRLPERPESRFEHQTHMIRSILFIPILVLLFVVNSGGILLWIATFFIALDLFVEAADALSERDSRQWQGGLTSGEYLLHLSLTTTRVAALVLLLSSKRQGAWVWSCHLILAEELPRITSWFAASLIPGTVLIAALHVILLKRPTILHDTIRLCLCFPTEPI